MDVHGRAPAPVYRLEGLDRRKYLPLVIGSAPGIEGPITFGGLKGRGHPFTYRVRRLNVVMAVDENRWLSRNFRALSPYHRVGFAAEHFDLGTSEVLEVIADPFTGTPAVAGVRRIGRYTGDAQERLELVQETRALGQDECVEVGHSRIYARVTNPGAKRLISNAVLVQEESDEHSTDHGCSRHGRRRRCYA